MIQNKESLGSDVARYQKWVDYDMKRYGKISDKTQNELDKAGLKLNTNDEGYYKVVTAESCENLSDDKKVNVVEALTDDDMQILSTFDITDDELSTILSIFEYISDENKDAVLSLFDSLFKGKTLVASEVTQEAEEKLDNYSKNKNMVSERYTRILLGNR